MTEKSNFGRGSFTREKYTLAFKVEYVRQVAAGARQSDVARAVPVSGVGRERGRLLLVAVLVAAKIGRRACFVVGGGASGLYAPYPPLRHPAVADRAGLHVEGQAVSRYTLRTWLD